MTTPRPHLLNQYALIQAMLSNTQTLQRDPGVLTAITASVSEHFKTLLSLITKDVSIENVNKIVATNSDRIIVRIIGPVIKQDAAKEVSYTFAVEAFVALNTQNDENMFRHALVRDVVLQIFTSIPIYGYTGTRTLGKFYGCASLTFLPEIFDLSSEDAKIENISYPQTDVNSGLRMFKVSTTYRLGDLSWQSWT